MKQIQVVAAIIHDEEGKVLATQRGYGEYEGWWEFPGGKMEQGETREVACYLFLLYYSKKKINVRQLLLYQIKDLYLQQQNGCDNNNYQI